MEIKHKAFIGCLIVFLLCLFLFGFRLASSYNFESDFARDLNDIINIIQGSLSLLGPKSSFGGIYTGPYYYYLFAPALILFRLDLTGILFFNACLFALSMGYLWYVLNNKYGSLKAAVAVLSTALLPVILFSARNPGNAYSYIPLLIFYIGFLTSNKLDSKLKSVTAGAVAGLLLTIEFDNAIFVAITGLYVFLFITRKRDYLFYLVGMCLPFVPLALFELKHQFVMIRNTFIDKSFVSFTQNRNLQSLPGSAPDIWQSGIFINRSIRNVLSLPLIAYMVTGAVLLAKNRDRRLAFLFASSAAGFLILIALFTKVQYAEIYLYPVALLLYISFILLLFNTRYWFLLFIVIIYQLVSFPAHLYSGSKRPAAKFEKAAAYVAKNRLVTDKSSFNVLQVRSNLSIAPYGYEYRYFLKKLGYAPKDITEYNQSNVLVIFSEVRNLDPRRLKNWEVEQYGRKHLNKYQEYAFEELKIYVLDKRNTLD